MRAVSSKLQQRARSVESGEYAAQASQAPSAPRTATVAPRAGLPATRATAVS